MTKTQDRPASNRPPLSRERVLQAAVALADEQGLESLSMRRLGQTLDVEAMSLYRHVANKDDLLDGMVDVVVAEFDTPVVGGESDWRVALRGCASAEHRALLRHPWAASLSESRVVSGPQRLGYYDALLGVLRGAGFSTKTAYRANLVLDSYLYGFTLQEVSWPTHAAEPSDVATMFAEQAAPSKFPNLFDVATLYVEGDIDIAADFEVGLDAVLDSLERLRQRDLGA